jgi:cyclopropane-fatty-acyl-phospholipid synthase
VIEAHYDPGSDIILSFLDPYNQYTCGYWKDCNDLNTAQEKKLDLICRKLELKRTDRVLDIGCGWYGFAKYAAEHYGCTVTGITIAREQIAYGREFCKGVPVAIKYCDYRDLEGTYDKILICGMSEHVGYKNYRVLAETVHRCLSRDGLFLWHTIGKGSERIRIEEPWILKYIFPNGQLPTVARVARATQDLFDMVDMHEFGAYYEPTLMAWRENLVTSWSRVGVSHTERDYRMWYYYLSSCAALFRVRKINLWQFVFRKAGGPGYISVR